MRDTFRRIYLPALLVAAIALLGAVPAWAELDAECVLRLAETATDEMTLAELRAQCRLPGDDAGQAPLAVSDDEVMPVEERLEAAGVPAQLPILRGGWGNDWLSGGVGSDGILGDDGRIFTSRNTGLTGNQAEYGVHAWFLAVAVPRTPLGW